MGDLIQLRLRQEKANNQELEDARRIRQILNNAGYDADVRTILEVYRQHGREYNLDFYNSTAGTHDKRALEAFLKVLEPVPTVPKPAPANARYQNSREAILNFIVQFKAEHNGIAPSIREIQQNLGISTHSIVAHHLNKMEHDGFIYMPLGTRVARAIAVPGYEFTKC